MNRPNTAGASPLRFYLLFKLCHNLGKPYSKQLIRTLALGCQVKVGEKRLKSGCTAVFARGRALRDCDSVGVSAAFIYIFLIFCEVSLELVNGGTLCRGADEVQCKMRERATVGDAERYELTSYDNLKHRISEIRKRGTGKGGYDFAVHL